MSTSQLKLLTWSLAGLLAAGLAGYIGWFVTNLEQVRTGVTGGDVEKVLNSVEEIVEEADEIVTYDRVQRGLIDFNWTGRPPAPPPDPEEDKPKAPVVNSTTPVARLVRVLYLMVDEVDPAESRVLVAYHPTSNVRLTNTYDGLLRVGDTLHSPHTHVKLVAVTAEGAVFGFDDENREQEVLPPDEFAVAHRIATSIGAAVGQIPERPRRIGVSSSRGQPRRHTQLSGDRVYMGTEDADYIKTNYSKILAEEVRTTRHRDPRTGKYDGIEIRSMSPDSTIARHGGREGDVVKSINGHAVSSVSDAISYVKQNANLHQGPWEVEVENLGKTRTVFIDPPGQR